MEMSRAPRRKEERQLNRRFARAVQAGDADEVFACCSAGVDVYMRDKHGATALHKSAGNDAHAVLSCLLAEASSSNIDMKDGYGDTALHCASRSGSFACAALLVAAGADPRLYDGQGRAAVELAERCGHGELAAYLRESTVGGGVHQPPRATMPLPSATRPSQAETTLRPSPERAAAVFAIRDDGFNSIFEEAALVSDFLRSLGYFRGRFSLPHVLVLVPTCRGGRWPFESKLWDLENREKGRTKTFCNREFRVHCVAETPEGGWHFVGGGHAGEILRDPMGLFMRSPWVLQYARLVWWAMRTKLCGADGRPFGLQLDDGTALNAATATKPNRAFATPGIQHRVDPAASLSLAEGCGPPTDRAIASWMEMVEVCQRGMSPMPSHIFDEYASWLGAALRALGFESRVLRGKNGGTPVPGWNEACPTPSSTLALRQVLQRGAELDATMAGHRVALRMLQCAERDWFTLLHSHGLWEPTWVHIERVVAFLGDLQLEVKDRRGLAPPPVSSTALQSLLLSASVMQRDHILGDRRPQHIGGQGDRPGSGEVKASYDTAPAHVQQGDFASGSLASDTMGLAQLPPAVALFVSVTAPGVISLYEHLRGQLARYQCDAATRSHGGHATTATVSRWKPAQIDFGLQRCLAIAKAHRQDMASGGDSQPWRRLLWRSSHAKDRGAWRDGGGVQRMGVADVHFRSVGKALSVSQNLALTTQRSILSSETKLPAAEDLYTAYNAAVIDQAVIDRNSSPRKGLRKGLLRSKSASSISSPLQSAGVDARVRTQKEQVVLTDSVVACVIC